MNDETMLQVMRVSCREEGQWVVVTVRPPIGVEGEILEVARVRTRLLREDQALWDSLQKWLNELGGSIVRNALGPEATKGMVIDRDVAPESERSGNG